jgi:hypothetical protein
LENDEKMLTNIIRRYVDIIFTLLESENITPEIINKFIKIYSAAKFILEK